jgi:4-amino-4-deoxy-L-arabinose transferase-like glycosyltransferase
MGGSTDTVPIKGQVLIGASKNILLLGLFILALSLKLFIFFFISSPVIFSKYPYFADKINRGMDIGERLLDLSPFYLYGMTLLQKLYGPNWEAMVIFQILTGSLTVLVIFLIGEKLFRRSVGLLAAVLLIFYGNLTLFELTLEPDSFILFFNALLVLCLLWAVEGSPSHYNGITWFLSGLLLGLSIITKANGLLIIPGILFWIWWTGSGKKHRLKAMGLFLLGTTLLVLPVTARNVLKFSDPVLITADMGKVFFHGNGPGATGMERADLPDQGFIEESGGEPDYAHVLFRDKARTLTRQNLKPSESSRFWILRTLEYMKAQPFYGLDLLLKKFFLFWQNYEVHDLDSTYAYYRTLRTWPLIPFGLISALGMLGLVLGWKNLKAVFLPFFMVMVYLITVIIFFNASRYRLPAVPFLALFAAHGFVLIMNRLKEKDTIQAFLLIGTVLVLFYLTEGLFKKETEVLNRWQQATRVHYNLRGNVSFKDGKFKEAIEEYKKALALAPGFAPAYNQMGRAYALLNDFSASEKSFQEVIKLSPMVDQGYLNLGLLYELKGEKGKAFFFLKKALELNPNNVKAKAHLDRLILGRYP